MNASRIADGVRPSQQPRDDGDDRNRTADRLRVAIARLARRLRHQHSGGLTASQLSALATVEAQPGIRLGHLAAQEGVTASSMTRIVAALTDAGLLARRPDPTDRRSSLVSLSHTGQQKLEQVRCDRTLLLIQRVHRLDQDDYARLAAAVPVLETLLDNDAPEGTRHAH